MCKVTREEKAYVITSKHFEIEEVNFIQLKEYTDNVILEYNDLNNSYFKRALSELDRLNYNIGILLKIKDSDGLENFINHIRGYKINLGVWLYNKDFNIYNILEENFKNNFITGIIDNTNENSYPSWRDMGDLSNYSIIMLDFFYHSIRTVRLNTNFIKLYEENNLKPINSNYKY